MMHLKARTIYFKIMLTVIIVVIFNGCQLNNENDLLYKSVRKTAVLEDGWRFQIDIRNIGEKEEWFAEKFDRSSWGKVTVPQAWDCYETALWGYEGVGWYAVTINPEDFTTGKRTEVLFNRIMYYSKVWINGEYIGENIGGYLPFSFDITDYLIPGRENHLVIRVDNKPRIEWLPAGKQIEWIQYGGILEPVELVSTSHTYINDFIIKTIPENGGARITCIIKVKNNTDTEEGMELEIEIARDTGITREKVELKCKPNETNEININLTINSADLWSPETPVLYTAGVYLKKDGIIVDDLTERFGIREVSIEGTSILLNGEPLTIKGVNRYDEYGRLGPNVPEEVLRKELALMKSAGINMIRVHYPQSPDLLSLYDEYGFMMMEEVPLNWWGRIVWGPVEQNLDILKQAKPALKKMIARDKNHPCIIIWSVANECETDNEIGITVMRELMKLAKSLDETRPVTFTVSHDPTGHLAFDEADIVCVNKYSGITSRGKVCYHIAQIYSFGNKVFAEELTNHRKDIRNKPMIITEFGCQGIKNIHGDVYFSEEFQAAYIESIWDAIRSVPGVSGGILWSWADYYHRKHFTNYAVYGPYGVVTVDRKPKKSFEALARMYGGSAQKQ
ncbi:glycoside hydrolase family 2 protein [candidate division KSB1 bacterium]